MISNRHTTGMNHIQGTNFEHKKINAAQLWYSSSISNTKLKQKKKVGEVIIVEVKVQFMQQKNNHANFESIGYRHAPLPIV